MLKNAITVCIAFFVVSCTSTVSTKKMNQISLEMTKTQVIEVMGDPDITKGAEGVEYLIYTLRKIPDSGTQAACAGFGLITLGLIYITPKCGGHEDDYFVKLENEKVSSYGKVGDFDSTKTPEATINVNETTNPIK